MTTTERLEACVWAEKALRHVGLPLAAVQHVRAFASGAEDRRTLAYYAEKAWSAAYVVANRDNRDAYNSEWAALYAVAWAHNADVKKATEMSRAYALACLIDAASIPVTVPEKRINIVGAGDDWFMQAIDGSATHEVESPIHKISVEYAHPFLREVVADAVPGDWSMVPIFDRRVP